MNTQNSSRNDSKFSNGQGSQGNQGYSNTSSNNNSSGSQRGFGGMSEDKRREAASRGGQTTANNYDMAKRGRKGGENSRGRRDRDQSMESDRNLNDNNNQ